ncbi:glutamate receptor ionotropic, delta-1-like [Zootermopsis nevadensis]|uniref:glutamate receptor ionotropic, delta-1-like n=1 Tax=Zootermopsis nevadensis TaxID=136037 RepID=UPI000B8EBCBA|nr:glutamate receptor ionotropic, delta-1-like [Zootermopsis nevadensis]
MYLLVQLARTVRLSGAKWLLFLDRDSVLEHFFADADIPFDCELLVAQPGDSRHVMLSEVYRVSSSLPLQTHRLGNWTPVGAFSWPTQTFYGRRNTLQGLVLKTGTIEHLLTVITKEENKKPMEVGGYYGDIWSALKNQMDFKADYYTPKDDSFGVKLDNGSWNGVVGMVVGGGVHVSNAAFMYNAPRMRAVDYLDPMSVDRMVIYVRKADSTDLVWMSFLAPFSLDVWVTLSASLFLLSAASLLLDRASPHRRRQEEEGLLLEFPRALFSVLKPFCWQGSTDDRVEVSWRVIQLTANLTALVIVVSYSASVLSRIMTSKGKLPFNSFEEFLELGTYTLAVGRHGGHFTHFQISGDPVLRAVYDRHMAPYVSSFPEGDLEALNMACARHNFAAVDLKNILPYYSDKLICSLEEVPKAVHNMHRSGILDAISKRNTKKLTPITGLEFKSVSLTQVTPVLVLLTTAAVAAMLLLTLENIIFRINLRFNKYNRKD